MHRWRRQISQSYILTFLLTGLGYGVSMAIYDLIAGDPFDLKRFAFSAVFFGTFMSLILVTYVRWSSKPVN